ncbi:MAG: NAD(P)H-dependent amine dehydrogenase family protein, partial [Panacagrimonas sp.]
MSQKRYRVIQWATGVVGKTALRHFIENPVFELVGVLVTKPEKVGLDAGDLAGLPRTGVLATDDVEKIIALDADCVLFSPIVTNVDQICRLLRSGKNVASVAGPFSPQHHGEHFARIEAACREGRSSYHACGIHPGFSGDILPLTLTRLMNRVDHIQIYEFIDKLRNPMIYTEVMGFGRDPQALLAKPSRSPEAPFAFAQSMALVAEGLGKKIEKVTTRLEVAMATQDIPYSLGIGLPVSGTIRQGTVAGQHYEWTAWVEGKPLITYHFYWTMGEDVEPRWDIDSRYQVVIEGDPPLEMRLMSRPDADGVRPFLGLPWT